MSVSLIVQLVKYLLFGKSNNKTIQTLESAFGKLYPKFKQIVDRLSEVESEFRRTSSKIDDIETEVREQQAILQAIAESRGIDLDEGSASQPEAGSGRSES